MHPHEWNMVFYNLENSFSDEVAEVVILRALLNKFVLIKICTNIFPINLRAIV